MAPNKALLQDNTATYSPLSMLACGGTTEIFVNESIPAHMFLTATFAAEYCEIDTAQHFLAFCKAMLAATGQIGMDRPQASLWHSALLARSKCLVVSTCPVGLTCTYAPTQTAIGLHGHQIPRCTLARHSRSLCSSKHGKILNDIGAK